MGKTENADDDDGEYKVSGKSRDDPVFTNRDPDESILGCYDFIIIKNRVISLAYQRSFHEAREAI